MPEPKAVSQALINHFHEYAAEWLSRESDAGGSCGKCHEAHTLDTLANQGFVIGSELKLACDACHAALSGLGSSCKVAHVSTIKTPAAAGRLSI